MNDNHLSKVLKTKSRYAQEDAERKPNLENQENEMGYPSAGSDINSEIKFLIGKLLKAKDKLADNLKASKFRNLSQVLKPHPPN